MSNNLTINQKNLSQTFNYTDIKEIRPTVESFIKTKNFPGPISLNFPQSTSLYLYPKKGEPIPLGIFSTHDLQKIQNYIYKVSNLIFLAKYL